MGSSRPTRHPSCRLLPRLKTLGLYPASRLTGGCSSLTARVPSGCCSASILPPTPGRTVAVEIRHDAASRELITCVLVKVANVGGCVVLLHDATFDGLGVSSTGASFGEEARKSNP